MFANCIPLILKFFNQNIMSYISAKNRSSSSQIRCKCRLGCRGLTQLLCFYSICVLDFPHCVVHEMPELTAESLASENCRRDDRAVTGAIGGSFIPVCVPLGSGGQQPVLLEKPVFLYQSAENPQQADQVETLQDHGERGSGQSCSRGPEPHFHAFFSRCLWFLSPPLF